MSNLQSNRISAELSNELLEQTLDQIQSISNALPFLLGLNKKERMTLPKINRGNKFFVQDAIQVVDEDKGLLPAYIKMEELSKDYELYQKLDQIQVAMEELYRKIEDTKMLAGSEAYSTSLIVYKMYQLAAKSGLPGAQAIYERLKVRFNGQGVQEETDTSTLDTE